jgi:hypothetical protein
MTQKPVKPTRSADRPVRSRPPRVRGTRRAMSRSQSVPTSSTSRTVKSDLLANWLRAERELAAA